MARLKQRTWLPLATNTYVTKLDHLATAVAMQSVDVVLVDPHFFGGMRAAVTAAAACGAFGLGVGMHSSGECGVSLAAMLHAAAAMPELAFAADAHYHYMLDDVITGGKLACRDGAMDVPWRRASASSWTPTRSPGTGNCTSATVRTPTSGTRAARPGCR